MNLVNVRLVNDGTDLAPFGCTLTANNAVLARVRGFTTPARAYDYARIAAGATGAAIIPRGVDVRPLYRGEVVAFKTSLDA